MYEKIILQIAKNELKKLCGKKHDRVLAQKGSDGFTYVCIAGTRLHRIINQEFIIDIDRLESNSGLVKLYYDCVDNNNDLTHFTGRTIEKDGRALCEYMGSENKTYYFDAKLIKEFGKPSDLTLIANQERPLSPAIVRDTINNMLDTGIICPVNMNI